MAKAAGMAVLTWIALQSALFLDPKQVFAPASWGVISVCIWLAYVVARGWNTLGTWDKRQFIWGVFGAFMFLNYLQYDPGFEGWSSVFFFCGKELEFCTCRFKWNLRGWLKAAVLWQFCLSAALGLQRFVIQVGLNGLLPGEEAVTKESFVSICWRLIPYWLNNWEQQWGAECSSMMFELPHFAIELLVVLPCVQILCQRLKVLVTPQVNVLVRPDDGPFVREDYAPNVWKGFWERQPEQRRLLNRVKSNVHIMAFIVALTSLAALNATVVPLQLEAQVLRHAGTRAVEIAGRHLSWIQGTDQVVAANATAAELVELPALHYRMAQYFAPEKGCPASLDAFKQNLHKHSLEIGKMRDPEHQALIPLVESALAIMRLSCEKYFTLIAIFLAFLLFRDPPRPARVAIRFIARLSTAFQKVILYSFPAVCWLYQAGFLFSAFVSVVFWGAPLMQLWESIKAELSEVGVKCLKPATAESVELMNGSCAICWGDMLPHGPPTPLPNTGAAAQPRSASGRLARGAPPADAAHAPDAAGEHQQQQQQHLHRRDHRRNRQHAEGAEAVVVAAPAQQPAVLDEGLRAPEEPAEDVGADNAPAAAAAATAAASTGSSSGAAAQGWALPCGHAYHYECLLQWLHQCHTQGNSPTCPMCQKTIELEVRWHWPSLQQLMHIGRAAGNGHNQNLAPRRRRHAGAAAAGAGAVLQLQLAPQADMPAPMAAGGLRRRLGGADAVMHNAAGAGGAAGVHGNAQMGFAIGIEEDLMPAWHAALAAGNARVHVVGLLQHQWELQELLHEAPVVVLPPDEMDALQQQLQGDLDQPLDQQLQQQDEVLMDGVDWQQQQQWQQQDLAAAGDEAAAAALPGAPWQDRVHRQRLERALPVEMVNNAAAVDADRVADLAPLPAAAAAVAAGLQAVADREGDKVAVDDPETDRLSGASGSSSSRANAVPLEHSADVASTPVPRPTAATPHAVEPCTHSQQQQQEGAVRAGTGARAAGSVPAGAKPQAPAPAAPTEQEASRKGGKRRGRGAPAPADSASATEASGAAAAAVAAAQTDSKEQRESAPRSSLDSSPGSSGKRPWWRLGGRSKPNRTAEAVQPAAGGKPATGGLADAGKAPGAACSADSSTTSGCDGTGTAAAAAAAAGPSCSGSGQPASTQQPLKSVGAEHLPPQQDTAAAGAAGKAKGSVPFLRRSK